MPGLPLSGESILIGLALIATLMGIALLVQGVRAFLHSLRQGGRGLFAEWMERKRLARQRERIQRQSIVSRQIAPCDGQLADKRERSGIAR